MMIYGAGVIAVVAVALVALQGCAPSKQIDPGAVRERSDIHERLSEAIGRDGFDYHMLTRRDGPEHIDVINIKLSLDSLKGRHLSLEKLMTDIGRVCSRLSYAHLPVRIRIGADDEDDQMYLYAVLATTVKGRDNITLIPVTDSRNEVIITIRHPALGGN
jgi:hypothetical protein